MPSLLFPLVYLLGVASLVVARNAQVKACNLEAVIFSLAIGLETKFSDLFSANQKKPLYAFLLAQTFNILLTLATALLLLN